MTVRLLGIESAFPEFEIEREALKENLHEVFGLEGRAARRIDKIVDHTGIDSRRLCAPIPYLRTPRPLGETSAEYLSRGLPLAEAAVRSLLEAHQVDPKSIDLIVLTSCTGIPIPSLDADLIDRVGFRRDLVRVPIAQMGCAGGAVGLARAADLLKGLGGSHALVVSVELPSLTFQTQDDSMANLVSTCIFGDGAAAALLTTEPGPGLILKRSLAHHFPRSRELMGFRLEDGGFHIVLDKEVPTKIRGEFPEALEELSQRQGLGIDALAFHALHPGGTKILAALEQALGLEEGGAWASRKVLAEKGNLSSATVLLVLKEILATRPPKQGDVGLLAAFGPGFTAEMQIWEMQ